MKLKKVFLLCCLPLNLLLFNACSNTSSDTITEIEQIQEELNSANVLSAQVNSLDFEADELNVTLEGSLIHIVGTDSETDRSIFLTFVLKENIQPLGVSAENINGNVAGYLLNSENIGYVTNTVEGISGEITISALDLEERRISGNFFFTAFNLDFEPIRISNGVFENVSFD